MDPLALLRCAGLSPASVRRALDDAFTLDEVGMFRLWLIYEHGTSRAAANVVASRVRQGLGAGDVSEWVSAGGGAADRARRRHAAGLWSRWCESVRGDVSVVDPAVGGGGSVASGAVSAAGVGPLLPPQPAAVGESP